MNTVINQVKALFPENLHQQIWLVGGTVRDLLLGQPVQDIDLVAALSGSQLEMAGFRPVCPVSSSPIWFKHKPGLGNVEVTVIDNPATMVQELKRRDFTINAMKMGLDGLLFDPLNGQADLADGQLRPCAEDSLYDDPIRVFRAFRFAADGWQLHHEAVQQLNSRQWEELFEDIPVERFSREMVKALARQKPELFFQLMVKYQTGTSYLPEIFKMGQVPAGPLQYHPEGDLFSHSIQVMQKVAAEITDPLARFCGLFHDLGKLCTKPELYPRHHGHDKAGFEPAKALCQRLKLPVAWGKALAWCCCLHTTANNWSELRPATKIRLAERASKAGISRILPLVSSADKPDSSTMTGWQVALQIAASSATELGIYSDFLQTIPFKQRPDYILQKQVELLKIKLQQHNLDFPHTTSSPAITL